MQEGQGSSPLSSTRKNVVSQDTDCPFVGGGRRRNRSRPPRPWRPARTHRHLLNCSNGDATSTAPKPATTSGKPASHEHNDLLLEY